MVLNHIFMPVPMSDQSNRWQSNIYRRAVDTNVLNEWRIWVPGLNPASGRNHSYWRPEQDISQGA